MAASASSPNPVQGPPSLKRSSSKQTSIAGFFQKSSTQAGNGTQRANGAVLPVRQSPRKIKKTSTLGSDQSLTPAPSSDPPEVEEDNDAKTVPHTKRGITNGLPSPITPIGEANEQQKKQGSTVPVGYYSPSRKVDVTSPLVESPC